MIDSLVDQHRTVYELLLLERRVIASVEACDGPSGSVALSTVGIQIGTRAILETAAGVVGGRKLGEARDLGLPDSGREEPEMIPGAQLVVPDSGGVREVAVHLSRLYSEHAACFCRVAGETVSAARVVPTLRAHRSRRRPDRDILSQARREEIRVAAVGAPLVDDAVHTARTVAHEQACLQ